MKELSDFRENCTAPPNSILLCRLCADRGHGKTLVVAEGGIHIECVGCSGTPAFAIIELSNIRENFTAPSNSSSFVAFCLRIEGMKKCMLKLPEEYNI